MDESLDVFEYFTASCYRGFEDNEGGFYAVYRHVFEKIGTEDMEFMDSDDELDIPSFGNSKSDYESVVGPFYAYWQSYCTKKSYSWLCEHNVSEIRDRRILRHIEKDTKKIAQKAKRERNDEVRALVAFVKKRDKRVIEYRKVLEQKAEINRQKQQEKRLQQIRKNQIEAAEMKKNGIGFSVDHEAQLRQLEAAYQSDSAEEEYDDDEEEQKISKDLTAKIDLQNGDTEQQIEPEQYIDHLYCVACNKSFKNESSLKNHEPSKKHKENIKRLLEEMHEEEEAYVESSELDDEESLDEESVLDEEELPPNEVELLDKNASIDVASSQSESNDQPIKLVKQKKSKKKAKQAILSDDDDVHIEIEKKEEDRRE